MYNEEEATVVADDISEVDWKDVEASVEADLPLGAVTKTAQDEECDSNTEVATDEESRQECVISEDSTR